MLSPSATPLLLLAEGGGGGLLSVETTLLWSTIALFALFAFVLWKFAWGPLLKIVDQREAGIRDQVESAEKAAAEARGLLAQHQEMLKGAGREREEILQKAMKEAESLRTDLAQKARADADHVMARAREQMERETSAAIADLRAQVADIAVEAAARIVRSSLTPEAQRKLVDDYIASLPSVHSGGGA